MVQRKIKRTIIDTVVEVSYFPNENHGLYLSGGLDSLSLLNWFSIDAPDLLKTLTLITIKKEPTFWAERIAKYYNIKKHSFVEKIQAQGESAKAARLTHPEIKQFYAAITKNPTVELVFKGDEALRGEKPTSHTQLPFYQLDKRYTLMLAKELNAPIILSHSCTNRDQDHCGHCYMCSERKWAFKELNLNDPATYTESV